MNHIHYIIIKKQDFSPSDYLFLIKILLELLSSKSFYLLKILPSNTALNKTQALMLLEF